MTTETTINTVEIYRNAGMKAGRAQRRRDQSLASEMNCWLSRALALENPVDRPWLREASNAAYREEARS